MHSNSRLRSGRGLGWGIEGTRRLAMSLVAVVVCLPASEIDAQVRSCFESETTLPWTGVDVNLDAPGGSRFLGGDVLGGDDDADYELCSISAGFGGEVDSFRFLTQPGDGDATLLAVLESIEPFGSAGLMVRRDDRDSASSHVRIIVTRGVRDSYQLRSAVRLEPGEPAVDGGSSPVNVTLPLLLKIERRDDVITTHYQSNGGFTEHLLVDTFESHLDSERLDYGMVQASNDRALGATASFRRASLTADDDPGPGIDCFPTDLAVPASGDTDLLLRGRNLDFVRQVTVVGRDARILDQSPDTLRIHVPAFDTGGDLSPRSGDIVLESEDHKLVLPNAIVFAGEPFIRGDANNDEFVDLSDGIYILLNLFAGGPSPDCSEAGDANDDGVGDLSDAVFLFQFLFLGGNRIPPPFPDLGVPSDPTHLCGLPPEPTWEELTLEDGTPVDADQTLREGDVVIFQLRGLDADPERLTVFFGDTPTRVLPRSTPGRLRLRVGPVPTTGNKCLLVFRSSNESERVSPDLVSDLSYHNDRGLALASDPNGVHTESCPRFEASRELQVVGTSEPLGRGARDGGFLLRFDRNQWTSLRTHHIELRVFPPLLSRGSRGQRLIRFAYFSPPPLGTRVAPGSDEDFERWLEELAQRIRVELAGGDPRAGSGDDPCDEDDPCDDVEAEPVPEDDG
ncbi:MAG: hypothetical protein AAF517_05225, partial [Planctomycetota bacterium]